MVYKNSKIKISYKNKRGQVTIFIIIAILVVVGVVLFFILSGDEEPEESTSDREVTNPEQYMKTCMEDDLQGTIRKVRLQGGSLEPEPHKSFQFEEEPKRDIAYLCYSGSTGDACVVQNAELIGSMENEIKEELLSISENCLNDLKSNYESEGYSVSGGVYEAEEDLVIDLKEDRVITNPNASEINIEKTGESRTIKDFKYEQSSPLYGLAKISNKIVQQEHNKPGGIDLGQFSIDYPNHKIHYETTQDQSKIYTITHIETNTKFRFGVRSYPLA